MGELVNIAPILKQRRLKGILSDWQEELDKMEVPSPTEFGWTPTKFVQGLPTQYVNLKHDALIGYHDSESVFLSYRGEEILYEMTLDELALGIETGTL